MKAGGRVTFSSARVSKHVLKSRNSYLWRIYVFAKNAEYCIRAIDGHISEPLATCNDCLDGLAQKSRRVVYCI